MLDLKRLLQSFEEIIGWPYQSPGSNDQNGIDCSGAFVRAYRAQGASIYHGSNRIIRVHCRDVIQVTSAGQLRPGMAVFKRRDDGAEPAEYKPGGKNYVPTLVGNYYHIGLVASVNPLRIIHATTPVAKVDTALGTWAWAGYLKDVNYGEEAGTVPTPRTDYATTMAASGSTVNLRKSPDGDYMLKIPLGTRIPVYAENGGWYQTNYNGFLGWIDGQYLRLEQGTPVEGEVPAGDYQQGYDAGYRAAVKQVLDLVRPLQA